MKFKLLWIHTYNKMIPKTLGAIANNINEGRNYFIHSYSYERDLGVISEKKL